MGGGLLQLIAIGEQDLYFTKDPIITLFKNVYKRHTNFAIESKGTLAKANINFGTKLRIKIEKVGDFINSIVVNIKLDENNNTWINRLGHYIFKRIQIEIGGKIIDTHDGTYLDIWYELNKDNHAKKYLEHINSNNMFIPLRFWFNLYIGNSIPLIALQYQDVYLIIDLEEIENLVIGEYKEIKISYISIINDYIFVDMDERKRVATGNYELLMQVIQQNECSVKSGINRIEIPFLNNIKEIIWVIQQFNNDPSNFTLYENNKINPLKSGRILFGNQDRVPKLSGNYFNYIQPYTCHLSVPKDGINLYSFSLFDNYQPAGYTNFSKVDNISLELKYKKIITCQLKFYAPSYNIFRINNGFSDIYY